MPTITIDVTEDLIRRLETTGVDVEPVCQRALLEAVRREESRQGREQGSVGETPTADLTDDRDESVLEADGYAAGMAWAETASSFDLATMFEPDGVEHDQVQVSREQGSLHRALELAGVRSDSETNRVLSMDDPWGRGFLRACRACRDVEQPLG
jgi:hypothetical protein